MMRQEKTIFATAVVALALSSFATAFINVQPSTLARFSSAIAQKPSLAPNANPLYHFSKVDQEDDNDNNLKDDWKTLTKSASSLVRKVGGKLKHAIQDGASKLKEIVVGDKVETREEPSPEDLCQQNEALFRSVLGDEGLYVVPSEPKEMSIDFAVNQAAYLLTTDEAARSLLGPSLRYGQPFSQSSWTTSVNGKSASTLRASFEVWGSQGLGVASVALTNGALTSLDLQVHGRRYKLNTVVKQPSHAEAHRSNNDDSIEVEILNGIRSRPSTGGKVWDAEILDI